MKYVIKGFILTGVFSICIICCSCKNSTGSLARPSKVVVCEASRCVVNAPLYLAMERGYFADERLDLQINTCDALEEPTESDAQYYILTTFDILNREFVNIAQLADRPSECLVYSKGPDLLTGDNLSDTKVLLEKTDVTGRIILSYVLDKHALFDKQKITCHFAESEEEMLSLLQTGKCRAAVFREPMVSAVRKSMGNVNVTALCEEAGFVPCDCICVTKEYYHDKKDDVTSFCAALSRGMDDLLQHKGEEIAEKIRNYFPNITVQELADMITKYQSQGIWSSSLKCTKEAEMLLTNMAEDYL